VENPYNDPVNANPDAVTGRGTKQWKNEQGELHRDGDLPAYIEKNGSTVYYKNGLKHRDGDKPAALDLWEGIKELVWWVDDMIHRDNGPAYLYSVNQGISLIQYNKRDEWSKETKKVIDGGYVTVFNDPNIKERKSTPEEIEDHKKWMEYLENYDESGSATPLPEEPALKIKPIFQQEKSELALMPDIDRSDEENWKLREVWKPVTPEMLSNKENIREELMRLIDEHHAEIPRGGKYPVRASVLSELVRIANKLDKLGLHEEADKLDLLVSKSKPSIVILSSSYISRLKKIAENGESTPQDVSAVENTAKQTGWFDKLKGMFGNAAQSVRKWAAALLIMIGACTLSTGCAGVDRELSPQEQAMLQELYAQHGYGDMPVRDMNDQTFIEMYEKTKPINELSRPELAALFDIALITPPIVFDPASSKTYVAYLDKDSKTISYTEYPDKFERGLLEGFYQKIGFPEEIIKQALYRPNAMSSYEIRNMNDIQYARFIDDLGAYFDQLMFSEDINPKEI